MKWIISGQAQHIEELEGYITEVLTQNQKRHLREGNDIDFSLDVNGTRKQSSNTRHMLYGLDEQIAEISRRIRIEPGDILFTGSPAGVGFPRGESVSDGDQVTARATGIGELTVAARASVLGADRAEGLGSRPRITHTSATTAPRRHSTG